MDVRKYFFNFQKKLFFGQKKKSETNRLQVNQVNAFSFHLRFNELHIFQRFCPISLIK